MVNLLEINVPKRMKMHISLDCNSECSHLSPGNKPVQRYIDRCLMEALIGETRNNQARARIS